MSTGRKMLTAKELAEHLNLTVETIQQHTRDNKIPHIDLGNQQYRYVLQDVMESLDDKHMVVCEEAAYSYSTDKIYTYSDYLLLPDEESFHYEILDGILIREPAPTKLHQRVLYRLHYLLQQYFWEQDPEAEIFGAPIDLTLSDINVVQPDLVYAPHDSDLEGQRINVIPELIVEIISPSTAKKDRIRKLEVYSRLGVPHYWIVDPKAQSFEAFIRDVPGRYTMTSFATGSGVFTHPSYPGLAIQLEALWRRGKV
jgi:excisionase family DNA binding protein